jgi:hypothetical protein
VCTVFCFSLVVGSLAAPQPAHADASKQQCIAADTNAQSLRREGKFAAARDQLRACADSACPDLVRNDCTQRLNELDASQPTIIFDAKDADGKDVTGVTVSVDGQPLADKLRGVAIPCDPGEHTFTFQALGSAPVTMTYVIKEGESARRERVVLTVPAASAPPAPPSPASNPTAAPPVSGSNGSTQRTVAWVAGGLGVAGIAVGSVFGLLAIGANNAQQSDCQSASSCSSRSAALSDHNTTLTDGAISTAGFIAGGILLATSAALFLTAPSVVVAPNVGPGTAGLRFAGTF